MRRVMRFGVLLLVLCLAACNSPAQTEVVPDASQTPSPIPATVTPTSEPVAARVNGEPITLRDYQSELQRYEAAMAELGIELATLPDYRAEVLQRLIERKLLAQAALVLGPEPSDAELQQRYDNLVEQRGGSQGMLDWLNSVGYAPDEFRSTLREELLAARMIDVISEGIASDVDQVHARHILVATEAEAQEMLDLLESGAEFDYLAGVYSLDNSTRPGGGDLGWFPRGTLTVPELETAAFDLQPGEISGIVHTTLGYHVLQVLERERRPLAGNDLIDYREAAVDRWLTDQQQAAAIEISVEP